MRGRGAKYSGVEMGRLICIGDTDGVFLWSSLSIYLSVLLSYSLTIRRLGSLQIIQIGGTLATIWEEHGAKNADIILFCQTICGGGGISAGERKGNRQLGLPSPFSAFILH